MLTKRKITLRELAEKNSKRSAIKVLDGAIKRSVEVQKSIVKEYKIPKTTN